MTKLSILIILFFAVIAGCELRSTLEPTEPDYINPDFPRALRGSVKINYCYAEDFAVSGDGYWVFAANRVRKYIDRTYVPDGPTSPQEEFSAESFQYAYKPNRLVASYYGDRLYCGFADVNSIYIIDAETMQESLLCETPGDLAELYLSPSDENVIAIYYTAGRVDFFHSTTGDLQNSCELPWLALHSSLSPDRSTLALYGPSLQEIVLIDVPSMSIIDTLKLDYAVTTLSFSGDNRYLLLFRGSTYKPAVNRYTLDDGTWWGWQECNRFYVRSHPIPGSTCVVATRHASDHVSVINAENMVFAPPLYCNGSVWEVEASDTGTRMCVMTRWPHRIRVFHLE